MTCKFRSIGPYLPVCNMGLSDCIHQRTGGYIQTCSDEAATEPVTFGTHVEISISHSNVITTQAVVDETDDDDLEDFMVDQLGYLLYSDEDEY